MRRFAIALAALLVLAMTSGQAHAGFGHRQRPSYGVWITTYHHGRPTHRYVYRGYDAGFPPPAFLYYGYPQNGSTSGSGL